MIDRWDVTAGGPFSAMHCDGRCITAARSTRQANSSAPPVGFTREAGLQDIPHEDASGIRTYLVRREVITVGCLVGGNVFGSGPILGPAI